LADIPAFYYGTSPNKFFDYISSGIPVISNYPGWLAGLVRDRQCGLVVNPGDPRAFADALCQLADNPGLRISMGHAARSLAQDSFSRSSLSTVFLETIESSLSGK